MSRKLPDDDAAFDALLAQDLSDPMDTDTSDLSRRVLSELVTDTSPPAHQLAEVLSEPLPWVAGLVALMMLRTGLGYLVLPQVDGGLTWFLSDVSTILSLAGGN